jgi:ArsR family transcriptional regulator
MVVRKTEQECCPPEGVRTTGNFDEDLSNLCKALGHPARVRLVRILVERGVCISGDLAEAMDLAPSTVSEHLRILKEAGLVQGTIDGPRRCYCINKGALAFVGKLLKEI